MAPIQEVFFYIYCIITKGMASTQKKKIVLISELRGWLLPRIFMFSLNHNSRDGSFT